MGLLNKKKTNSGNVNLDKTGQSRFSVLSAGKAAIAPEVKAIETVQDAIPIHTVHDKHNLIESYPGQFSRTYLLSEINYQTLNESEQEHIFQLYKGFLNSLGSNCDCQISIFNRNIDIDAFCDSVLKKERGDDLDDLRRELNKITLDRVREGKNGIRADKYITLSLHAPNVEKAAEAFERIDRDINNSLVKIGSAAKPIGIEDRLDILHDIYNPGHTGEFLNRTKVVDSEGITKEVSAFDFDNLRSLGLRVNDVLAPSSIAFKSSYIEIGDKYAKILKVSDYPSMLSDEFFTNICSMDFNLLATFSLRPFSAIEADNLVRLNFNMLRLEKQKALQRAMKDGGDESMISPAILDREKELLEIRADMRERDERLFQTTLTFMVFADNLTDLQMQSDTIVSEARKSSVDIRVMTNLQDDGFYSTLPLCYNRIMERRTMKSTSVATLLPFSVTELNDPDGINYSMNAVTHNLILYDRTAQINANGFILGSSGCVDCETEYFNGKEWKSIADYREGELVLQFDPETNKASLVKPERYIKAPCDKMYHFKTKYGIDQMLSPEHRVIYYTKNSHNKNLGRHVVSAEEVAKAYKECKFHGFIKTDFVYDGPGIDLQDVEIKLMLAIIADGHFNANNPDSLNCAFNLKKSRKKNELYALLQEYCGSRNFRMYETDDGFTHYSFYAPRREKTFEPYWYRCSQRQLQLVCDNILQWDGRIDKKGRKLFSTSDKASADFVQFAFSACGYRAVIGVNDQSGQSYMTGGKEYIRKSKEYYVSICDNTMVSMKWVKKDHPEGCEIPMEVPSDGMKYCFTVPTHALVLRRNGRLMITGNSGKSFSAKLEMLSVLLGSDSDVIVIDPEAEYGALCEALHGTTITLKPGGSDCINPMAIYTDRIGMDESDPVLEKADFILSLCANILGKNKWGIDSIQEAIIDQCVHQLYDPFYKVDETGKRYLGKIPEEKMPTLTDLFNLVRQRPEAKNEAKDLVYALSMYANKGSLNVFSGQTTVNLNNRFTVIDIHALGKKLKSVAMLIVMDMIWNKIVENRKIGRHTWFYVDEIYLLFREEETAEFLQALWKRARKYGGCPTGITQNVEDLLLSPTARGMLANSSFVEIFNQAATDREQLTELLHLSESQKDVITDAPRGQGLIYTGSQTVTIYSQLPKDSKIYRYLTSDLVEIKAYEEEELTKRLTENYEK